MIGNHSIKRFTIYKDAIIFSDGTRPSMGGKWNGFAGETNWNTLNGAHAFPGYPNYKELTPGYEDGTHWIPAECDVSIRPGWFYSPRRMAKWNRWTIDDIYLGSVVAENLLLNVL